MVFGKSGQTGSYVRPVLTTIARDLHQAIVSANPDYLRINRRDRDREDRVVSLCPAEIEVDITTAAQLFALVIAREIGADRVPVRSAVGGFEEHIATQIHLFRIGR